MLLTCIIDYTIHDIIIYKYLFYIDKFNLIHDIVCYIIHNIKMIKEYLESNIATSKEIQQHCNLTARQVGLRLKKLGNSIIKIANGKSPKYALTVNAFGSSDEIYIWEVDNFGKHSVIAILRPLATGGFFVVKGIGMPRVFLGERGNGLYDDLPYFLRDMAPKGFLGKKIAEKLSQINESFPRNLDNWKNEHIGRYLLSNTNNSIGNLKFGNNVDLNIRQSFEKSTRKDYLNIADNLIDNDVNLSSAGGEQQKFTTFCTDIDSHTIVKFSPKGDSENAKRWKDILISEHCANEIITKSGFITAAQTHIFEDGGRVFLESKRFDRSGEYGRKSMLSLTMIDAEFAGSRGDNWLESATILHKNKLLTNQDLIGVESLAIFAKLINNTDTHLGNISFEVHNDGFALLPIYDMCCMGFAPKGNGDIIPLRFDEPNIKIVNDVHMPSLEEMAKDFWKLLSENKMLSNELKQFIIGGFGRK